jgi:hypothetical protein
VPIRLVRLSFPSPIAIILSLPCGEQKWQNPGVKYWEIIADNLSKAGWSYGYVSALDCEGRTIWIVDAHGYGKRFIVRADEMLAAFVERKRPYTSSR